MAIPWEYRVVPFAAGVKAGGDRAQAVAGQLQALITAQMNDGFEYWRLDHVSLYEAPGCVPALFGAKQAEFRFDVAIFRRAR